MNFSFCLLGVFFLVLHDICLAKVLVKYKDDFTIDEVYAERKKHDRHLGHLATYSEDERIEVCNYYRPRNYVKYEESKPHMYKVKISDSSIPKDEPKVEPTDEKDVAGSSKPKSTTTEEKEKGIEVEQKVEMGTEDVEKSLAEMKLKEKEKPEKTLAEGKEEPAMIYDEEIGFRCHSEDPKVKDVIIIYGFGQRMFFIADPIGEIDHTLPFSNRQIQFKAYMYEPPILGPTGDSTQVKYLELRQRTEKARKESKLLLDDIETHDDILALLPQEKNILCASIMDTTHYKNQGYKPISIPTEDAKAYDYVKLDVAVYNENTHLKEEFPTDFMQCQVERETSPDDETTKEIIGVTRSYAEGGKVFTSKLNLEPNAKQIIDVEVIRIPVLFNRKYAGEREGVLDLLETIRGTPTPIPVA